MFHWTRTGCFENFHCPRITHPTRSRSTPPFNRRHFSTWETLFIVLHANEIRFINRLLNSKAVSGDICLWRSSTTRTSLAITLPPRSGAKMCVRTATNYFAYTTRNRRKRSAASLRNRATPSSSAPLEAARRKCWRA